MMMSIAHGSNDGKCHSYPQNCSNSNTNNLSSCERCWPLGGFLQHLRDWRSHAQSRHSHLDPHHRWSLARHWVLEYVLISHLHANILLTSTLVYGFNVMRSLGNKITQVSPTRGFAMELGAAITVLLASRLGLPVSTTQCLTGATIGVALCNFDVRAVNWKQIAFIFSSWIITLPSAGLISGLLMAMALNTPHF